MIFVKHIFNFSQTAAQIFMKFGSYMRLSKVTKVCSNQGCMTYFLGSYVTCIFTISNYMSLCNIPLLTSSLEPLYGFDSNFVWIVVGWTPTKLVKIGVLLLFFMELWVILCNFWPILKKSSSIKPLTRNHSYLVWRVPRGSSF